MNGHPQRGGITLEMAIVLPVLLALIFGGAAVAYGALAKASLQMATMRAARELAADEAAKRMKDGQVYWYREFTETYGLPRAKVRMIIGDAGGIIVAGACYRVPLPLPQGLQQEPRRLHWAAEFLQEQLEKEFTDPQTASQIAQDLNDFGYALDSAVRDALTLRDQAAVLLEQINGFRPKTILVRDEFVPIQNAEMGEFDELLGTLCGGRGITVTAKSAFWSEDSVKTYDPIPPLEVVKLEPNPVNLHGAGPPGPKATIVVKATEPTTCDIEVEYKSGPSKAEGLQKRAATREVGGAHLAEWQWHVGTNTSEGTWPVKVWCDNGQSVTTYLTVERQPK